MTATPPPPPPPFPVDDDPDSPLPTTPTGPPYVRASVGRRPARRSGGIVPPAALPVTASVRKPPPGVVRASVRGRP